MYEGLIKEIIPKLKFKFPYEYEDYCNNLYLEDYHCHKDFSNTSVPDCAESIENYAIRVKELKAKCLYSGEHGSQGNQFQVYNVAESNNLKYRHSTEAYWVKDRLKIEIEEYKDNKGKICTREKRDRTNCHMILVAKNQEGRGDINYALSFANIDGFFYRPRIDLNLLFQIPKDNIIVTSACIAGWNYEDAEDIWLQVFEYFGNNFFLEVQANNTDKQKKVNKKIIEMSKKYGIQIICGLDTHYITDESSKRRDQILEYKKVTYPEENGWYMDYPDVTTLITRFKEQGVLTEEEILTAIMNTNVFVNECEDIILDRKFKIPSAYKDKTYEEKCSVYKNILNKQYKKEKFKSKEKEKGIVYEANQVMESGVVDYFLTTKAIIDLATSKYGGILTTTSRGSSASFVTNKLLGITTIDRFTSEIPIYPERFLTKERVMMGQMPDIDNNITAQEPFVLATRELLGEHGCYPLMAIEKLKVKNAWQLYASNHDVSPKDANMVSKFIEEYEKAVKYADDEDKDSIDVNDFIPDEYQELFHQSNDYQGITINLKCHACGFMLLDGDIRREIGLITAESKTTKKRTLCACIEGGYLDEFGYVKEDFLIVDSVGLIAELFKSINKEVPTFDELREMIKEDQLTWNIYEKGITCCINQCEKEATSNRGKKYKPTTLSEISAFIAGIRPGFASLLSTFLNRESYTTGEPLIDELLKDSSRFMLYQESIMKVLSFLGVPMNDTYGVIKSISKKKLKGEKKEKLKNTLRTNWLNIFGNLDNFDNVWSVIEDSARYAFNSPHALSMGGDSTYLAWFKAHHTAKFYEVAINHYQEKNKKDKIDALVKEIIKFYGYRLGSYKFGSDNRKVTVDEVEKVIYPNLSSVKGFGSKIAVDLYELGKNMYIDFFELYKDLDRTPSLDKTTIEGLIRIEYFSDYGDVNYLLQVVKYFNIFFDKKDNFYGRKEIAKDKLCELNIPFELAIQYGSETPKKITKLDSVSLFNEIVKNIDYQKQTMKQKLDNQHDVLGIVSFKDDSISNKYLYVSELEVLKSIVNVKLHEIKSGETRDVKMWTNAYNKKPFSEKDLLYVLKIDKKNKKEPTGEINEQTGKKIYKDVEGQYEFWLTNYINKGDFDE